VEKGNAIKKVLKSRGVGFWKAVYTFLIFTFLPWKKQSKYKKYKKVNMSFSWHSWSSSRYVENWQISAHFCQFKCSPVNQKEITENQLLIFGTLQGPSLFEQSYVSYLWVNSYYDWCHSNFIICFTSNCSCIRSQTFSITRQKFHLHGQYLCYRSNCDCHYYFDRLA